MSEVRGPVQTLAVSGDEAGLRAAWSTPLKAASGKLLGSLGVYRKEPGLPTLRESEIMAHAAQLAGIAIQRRLAEKALLRDDLSLMWILRVARIRSDQCGHYGVNSG